MFFLFFREIEILGNVTNVTFTSETKLISNKSISRFLSQRNRPNKETKFFR